MGEPPAAISLPAQVIIFAYGAPGAVRRARASPRPPRTPRRAPAPRPRRPRRARAPDPAPLRPPRPRGARAPCLWRPGIFLTIILAIYTGGTAARLTAASVRARRRRRRAPCAPARARAAPRAPRAPPTRAPRARPRARSWQGPSARRRTCAARPWARGRTTRTAWTPSASPRSACPGAARARGGGEARGATAPPPRSPQTPMPCRQRLPPPPAFVLPQGADADAGAMLERLRRRPSRRSFWTQTLLRVRRRPRPGRRTRVVFACWRCYAGGAGPGTRDGPDVPRAHRRDRLVCERVFVGWGGRAPAP